MSNDTHDTTETTSANTITPDERAEARRLIADLLAWGPVLRDAQAPGGLFAQLTPEGRIASHAWTHFQAAAMKLERLFSTPSDTQGSEETDA